MPASPALIAVLVGQSDTHLCTPQEAAQVGDRVHHSVVEPFLLLSAAARANSFELTLNSGFRSFERQLSIWNRKVSGELAVLDSDERPLDITTLSPRELVLAILRWSALPGASRHHWGTDLDVYDGAATPPGYEVQLLPSEVEPGGMHGLLHEWLDERIATGTAFGFYRPYDADRGGVAPERWHLSYAPISTTYLRMLTPDLLRATIAAADMLLKDVVLADIDNLYERFVINTSQPAA